MDLSIGHLGHVRLHFMGYNKILWSDADRRVPIGQFETNIRLFIAEIRAVILEKVVQK